MEATATAAHREPWNKGKIVGQKAPFKLKDIWVSLTLALWSAPAMAIDLTPLWDFSRPEAIMWLFRRSRYPSHQR